MAIYAQVNDPKLQRKVRDRYVNETATLQGLGFRHLAYCSEVLAAFSAVIQLPILLLTLPKREVLIFPWPLRLGVANVLLIHSDPPAIALCMGMGVKLYTAFTNSAVLITSTFQSHATPHPTSFIRKSPAYPTLELAWDGHKDHIREMEREGMIIQPGLSFDSYVEMSRREEDYTQYR